MIPNASINENPLEEMIILAQKGDKGVQNYLLKTYKPFIAKCVSEVCRRYIDPQKDDEYSIGLLAFNEAILKFSPERGSSFLSFAKLVVKRKVIDYIRYVQKTPITASLNEVFDEKHMQNQLEITAVNEIYRQEQDAQSRREEINDFRAKLGAYKLSLTELTEASPKHKDARDSAVRTARILFADTALSEYVRKKKKLPIKDLVKKVEVSKKTLERNRKFILAIFIVLSEDYVYLQDYLKGVGKCKKG